MAPSTYSIKDYDIFMGIDVDKNSFAFTVKDHDTMSRSKKIPSQPRQLLQYVDRHFPGKRVLFAYEAGPTGYDLHDNLVAMGRDCLVLSPLSMPKAPNQKVKNNRIDSDKITQELKGGKLVSIRVPHGAYRELRHLIASREDYVYNRKVAKQRIKALTLFAHLYPELKDIEENWSGQHIRRLKQLPCSEAVRLRLDMLLKDLEYARGQTAEVLHRLRQFVAGDQALRNNVHYLTSIPGVGFITAVSVLGRIGDPGHLKNVRELGAFIGLVPSEHSTGNNVRQGSITHLGNRQLRALIVEAAWSAKRKDTELDQFYHRIKKRHHPKVAARKAIVAVARKLTHRMYAVLKEQRPYVIH